MKYDNGGLISRWALKSLIICVYGRRRPNIFLKHILAQWGTLTPPPPFSNRSSLVKIINSWRNCACLLNGLLIGVKLKKSQ